MFVDRQAELSHLEDLYRSGKAELFILYGRRRVGKTDLLQQFCRDKRAVYSMAAQVREPDNLQQLKEATQYVIDDPLLETMEFNEWSTALSYLAQQARDDRLVVVLDEFQYPCDENRSLPSIVQRFWDTLGKNTQLFLIICGSHVSFMEKEILSEKSPLFGRRTGQQRLLPLSFVDASQFFPDYSPREKLTCYGILGGVPAYLVRFASERSIRQNVLSEMLQVQGYLYDEVNFLLRMELANPTAYASILKAIASGCTRLNEIAQRVAMKSTTVSKYLHVLQGLCLVRREVCATERAPEKSKKGLYLVDDAYVNFWFRFVMPHSSLIQAGDGRVVWEKLIAPQLPTYMGELFELICRQYVQLGWGKVHGQYVRSVGKCWGGDYDVDIVAKLVGGGYLLGECKWWQSPVGLNILAALREDVARLPERFQRGATLAIFSLSGFTRALVERAQSEGVVLVSARDLLVGIGREP